MILPLQTALSTDTLKQEKKTFIYINLVYNYMPFKAFNNVHSNTDKHLTFLGKNKRSQSALEYMMTYGWAILIIVIVAVVLYSMGIFSPSSCPASHLYP